jgi:CHASE2 domain-containing sensor protein
MKKSFVISVLVFVSTSICCSQKIERDIVLINAINLDRLQIANLLSILTNKYNAKLVSIDLIFKGREGKDDQALSRALLHVKKLVMATHLNEAGQGLVLNIGSETMFYPAHAKEGFSNPILEKDLTNTLRSFQITPESKFHQINSYHFAIRTAMCLDSLKTIDFIRAHSNTVDIDYKEGKRCFKMFAADDVINGKVQGRDIENKTVLIGDIGPENKYVIPLYKKGSKVRRQMDGLEVIANIISQILEF